MSAVAPRRIAIVGTGSMGSVYAGLFAAAGHEVWAVDVWADHVDAMASNGLRLEGASGDRVVPVRAVHDAREVPVCDLVIIATKVGDVTSAARSAQTMVGPDTAVLSIQNGLGGPQRTAEILGDERVLVGVVGGFGASLRGPGHAHHNGMELVRLGEMAAPVGDRVRTVAELWRHAGFTVATFDDVHQLVWEKLICNVAFSGPCALSGYTIGEVLADTEIWSIAADCATEAWRVATALGIPVNVTDPVDYVARFGEKIPDAKPSLLLDHLAGRASEIDAINGSIAPAGEPVGVDAPVNQTVSRLVRQRETQFEARPTHSF